ncbi:hypothetical protein L6452_20709 [Arctium lappa]|uniref:Uncharacterized protein n=1 Tax=Arctium lappa TaxID=4217 RepID=A0ACB9BB97_ARCLA|nr:hypothetical protein L6452_20709 [Arctium lappa]
MQVLDLEEQLLELRIKRAQLLAEQKQASNRALPESSQWVKAKCLKDNEGQEVKWIIISASPIFQYPFIQFTIGYKINRKLSQA